MGDAPIPSEAMLEVAVFSYNRGAYLENCVASVRRHLPGVRVRVWDDHSDQPETLAVLASLGVEVIRPPRGVTGRLGGLYGNMQEALDAAEAPLILFLQEDMQLVRPVTPAQIAGLMTPLNADPRSAFLSPVFMKGRRMARHRRRLTADEGARLYRGAGDTLAYHDVSIGHVARLRAADWRFAASEHANVLAARAVFSGMAWMADPFVFYCPEVPVFRDRRQSLAARMAARVTGGDVKRLRDMTDPDAFCARPLSDWPEAERYLTPENPAVRRPFVYKDVKARWWLAALHRVERALRW